MRKLFVLFVILIVPLAFAGRPPGQLLADTVTSGDAPAVQSIGNSSSAQPVDIMNWLIDENGNLKVSNQVRDQVIVLADAPFTLPAGETWASEWFSTRTFNALFVHGSGAHIACNIDWRWSDTIRSSSVEFMPSNPVTATSPWRIAGPEALIRCLNNNGHDVTVAFVAVYLRAE